MCLYLLMALCGIMYLPQPVGIDGWPGEVEERVEFAPMEARIVWEFEGVCV